jgi:ADP-ribose pyrophosphatase
LTYEIQPQQPYNYARGHENSLSLNAMSLPRWQKLRQVFEKKNPWWTYRHDEVKLPSGKTGEYHFVHVNGSSMIIPFLDDGTMILVNQYRYLRDRESLEFPCGSVKDGATYDETAAHELTEETGYHAEDLNYIAEFNPYNGVTDEMCRVYIAKDLKPAHAQKDETEEFEYVHLTPTEFEARIASGEIWDGMTLAAWAVAKHRILS